ncbi:MAG: peptidylprolyl isomerase [Burkholderiaceae bacterium]
MKLSKASICTAVCVILMCGNVSAQNAVIVNNEAIPLSRVDAFVKAMVAQGRPDTPELREMVREELISRELFVQEAQARKLATSPEVENQLIRARQDILIQALIRNELATQPITDEEVQAAYAKQNSEQKGELEYRASHILVEDAATAKKIIADLKKGGDFKAMAKQSKDPGSAARGGDLDWNSPSTFVPAFSEAMVNLKKGEYTNEPVKTDYGYHVIRLDDTREAQPPSLESVKPQLRQGIERQRILGLQKALRDKAKIE